MGQRQGLDEGGVERWDGVLSTVQYSTIQYNTVQ